MQKPVMLGNTVTGSHSLQTATTEKGGRDDEYVRCTLLHDIGDNLAPLNHRAYSLSWAGTTPASCPHPASRYNWSRALTPIRPLSCAGYPVRTESEDCGDGQERQVGHRA